MSENSTKIGLVDYIEIRPGKDKTVLSKNVFDCIISVKGGG